jgi:hypothetical protein
MVRIRRSSTPSARSSRARNDWCPPRRGSFDDDQPGGASDAAMPSRTEMASLRVAGADAHVHDRRLPVPSARSRAGQPAAARPTRRAAERLDHPVGGWRQLAGGRAIGAVELHLPAQDLRPRGIVADDPDDVDLLADAGLELHHVEPEGAVAVHDDDVALGRCELRRHRVPRARPQRAERPGVEPVPKPRAEHVPPTPRSRPRPRSRSCPQHLSTSAHAQRVTAPPRPAAGGPSKLLFEAAEPATSSFQPLP